MESVAEYACSRVGDVGSPEPSPLRHDERSAHWLRNSRAPYGPSLCRPPSPSELRRSPVAAGGGSSLGSCGTSRPRTARLRMVWRSCWMCSGRVVRRGRWRRWKRACSRKVSARRRRVGSGGARRRRHQPVAAALALGLRRLQPVAQRHQLVDLGDDAVLLGEGWEGNGMRRKICHVRRSERRAVDAASIELATCGASDAEHEEVGTSIADGRCARCMAALHRTAQPCPMTTAIADRCPSTFSRTSPASSDDRRHRASKSARGIESSAELIDRPDRWTSCDDAPTSGCTRHGAVCATSPTARATLPMRAHAHPAGAANGCSIASRSARCSAFCDVAGLRQPRLLACDPLQQLRRRLIVRVLLAPASRARPDRE